MIHESFAGYTTATCASGARPPVHAEDKKHLPREEVVFSVEPKAGRADLIDDLSGCKPKLDRRSRRRLLPKIDDRHSAAPSEIISEPSKVRHTISDVVIGIDDQHEIDRLREICPIMTCHNGDDVVMSLTLGTLTDPVNH